MFWEVNKTCSHDIHSWHEWLRFQRGIHYFNILLCIQAEDFTIHRFLSEILLWMYAVHVSKTFYWWSRSLFSSSFRFSMTIVNELKNGSCILIGSVSARSEVFIIIIIYPLIARVVEAPQMISQPVSSIFPVFHCPLGLGELQACPFPDDVFPLLPLSALSSSPFNCAFQDGFGQTWWTADLSIPLQFASL